MNGPDEKMPVSQDPETQRQVAAIVTIRDARAKGEREYLEAAAAEYRRAIVRLRTHRDGWAAAKLAVETAKELEAETKRAMDEAEKYVDTARNTLIDAALGSGT